MPPMVAAARPPFRWRELACAGACRFAPSGAVIPRARAARASARRSSPAGGGAAEQLLHACEPVAQRVRVHVHRLGGGVDVHVAREVLDQRLQQRRVGLQRRQQLLDARADVLGRDLAEQQRREVEVLVGELALASRARRRAARRGTSAGRRRCLAPAGRSRRAARPGSATRRPGSARRVRSPRGRDAGARRRRRTAARSTRVAARALATTTTRAGVVKSSPKEAARAASARTSRPPSSASSSSARADRALLVAREVAQALGRRQQRHGGLGGGPGEPRREQRGRGSRPPASPSSPIGTLTTCQPSCSNSRSPIRAARSASGTGAARGLDAAVGGEDQHAGVEHARQPLDHHLARARLAQRVDEVALDRVQPLVGVQVAGEQRAVDEADDVAERRAQRHGQHRERALARPPPAARAGRA